MVVGSFLGAGLGVAGGILAGSFIFSQPQFSKLSAPAKLTDLDLQADYDDNIEFPETSGKPIPAGLTEWMSLGPAWLKWPDYERVNWINLVVKTLWATENKALQKMVHEQLKVQLDTVYKQYPFVELIDLESLDLGTKPIRIGGVKVFDTSDSSEEEVMMEMPVIWGSNAFVRVVARLKVLGYVLQIPVEVANIQLKAVARITLKPLVEELPCLGAVEICLLDNPFVDLSLRLINKLDLMALPGIREAALFGAKMAMGMFLVYPNKMSFPIMDNGGVPPPPIGMLVVKVMTGQGLPHTDLIGKSDQYLQLSVRPGRKQKTQVVSGSHPTWDEEFTFIVDDPEEQRLTVLLYDDDVMNDTEVGLGYVSLANTEFMRTPWRTFPVTCQLIKPDAAKHMLKFAKGAAKTPAKGVNAVKQGVKRVATLNRRGKEGDMPVADGAPEVGASDAPPEKGASTTPPPGSAPVIQSKHGKVAVGRGEIMLELKFLPFAAAGVPEAEPTSTSGVGGDPRLQRKLTRSRTFTAHLTDDIKGVLTVTVIKCQHLEEPNGNDVDAFVELRLNDPAKHDAEVQRTGRMFNEPHPRWGEKFDFVSISATSKLSLIVYDRQGLFEGLHTLKSLAHGKKPGGKQKLGVLTLDVADTVRNQRLHSLWPLEETQAGEIELALQWTPIEMEDPGAQPAGLTNRGPGGYQGVQRMD